MNLEDWTMSPAKYIVWIELTQNQKEEIKGISYEEWFLKCYFKNVALQSNQKNQR